MKIDGIEITNSTAESTQSVVKDSISKGSIPLQRRTAPSLARRTIISTDLAELFPIDLASPPDADDALNQPVAIESLHNFLNNIYTAEVFLGSKDEKLAVIFDTGSADFWSTKTDNSSSTLVQTDARCSVQYAKGSVEGKIVHDTLTIPGLTPIKDQPFIMIDGHDDALNVPMGNGLIDGLIGLGFKGLSSEGNSRTVLESLRNLDISGFSFFLTGEKDGSQIAFGNTFPLDWDIKTPMNYFPVTLGANFWWSATAVVHVGDFSLPTTVIFDTGTSFVAVPQHYYVKILRSLLLASTKKRGAECKIMPTVGVILCPCKMRDEVDPIEIMLQNDGLEGVYKSTVYTLKGSDLFRNIPFLGDYCMLELGAVPDNFPFILGDTFLRTVAINFDIENSRVGLATRVTRESETISLAFSLNSFFSLHLSVLLMLVLLFMLVCRFYSMASTRRVQPQPPLLG